MIKNILFGIIIASTLLSCVSAKIYEDLKDNYDHLKAENESLMSQLDGKSGNGKIDLAMLERAGVAFQVDQITGETRSDQFARFQSDAPGCDNCGALTVRNGNCYLCHNCGNSMGCS